MIAFEMVTIAVAVAGGALCASSAFMPRRTLGELGRQGGLWFDHAEDHDMAELPADDDAEEPITFRPLRSRLR